MSTGEPGFGTDGVRGVANRDLTAHLALRIGMAAAVVLGRHSTERHVVVGRDTRLSGDMLEAALNAGLASMGARVSNVGVVPTPAVSRIVRQVGATAGAVISASHNPFEDNGIKLLGSDGRKLSDDVEQEIAAEMGHWRALPRPTGSSIGRIIDVPELAQSYLEQVRAAAPPSLKGLRLVMDCANGATSGFAPGLFADLGADLDVVGARPDGVNINLECGSTHLLGLQARVREGGAHCGLAFDGDGDRVLFVDEAGVVVDGDHLMAICALAWKAVGRLEPPTVVATVMSNAGLDVALEEHDICLRRTAVGDRYVAEEMDRTGALVGGEQSGHILLAPLTATGDGMVTALQVLGHLQNAGGSLSELASVMRTCPQTLRSVRLHDRESWQADAEIAEAIEAGRARLGRPEWLSVRASGTEPVVRVMAQDQDADVVKSVVDQIVGLLQSKFGD